MKKSIQFLIGLQILIIFSSVCSSAEITFLSHSELKVNISENEIRELYLGIKKMGDIKLTDQARGQAARDEFYDKFLKKSENQIKQRWSTLIFTGEKVPITVDSDLAALEFIKKHANAIVYVSSDYWKKEKAEANKFGIAEVFSIK